MSKSVYIASPYALGNQHDNVKVQIHYAEFLTHYGFIPFWPLHSHYWHILYNHPAEFWLEQDFYWVKKCDILLRLPGESKGADSEVKVAQEAGIPVYFSLIDLLEKECGVIMPRKEEEDADKSTD